TLVVCGSAYEFEEYRHFSRDVDARWIRHPEELRGLDLRTLRLIFFGRYYANLHLREIVDVWHAMGGRAAEVVEDPRRAAYEQEQERIRVLQQQQMLAHTLEQHQNAMMLQ